jgi:hypothetical protein
MSTRVISAVLAMLPLVSSIPAPAEAQGRAVFIAPDNRRSGPRIGFTFLGGSIVDSVRGRDSLSLSRLVTQFGWHVEREIASSEQGPSAVTEWVLLIGGLEQGIALPSLSWLVGVRTKGNFELGVGPNITPFSTSLVVAGGAIYRSGALNIPLNVAVIPSRIGTRVTFLTGYNVH